MSLTKYKKKRSFDQTPEPPDKEHKGRGPLKFVVQKHNASHLHYDFRLEMEGVLKSWAVPKGPSMNPDDKRLAMMVEDHPYDYRTFEGIIPEGNYGAGQVIVWDEGTYHPIETTNRKEAEKILLAELAKGHLTFILEGEKLKGEFALVKIRGNNRYAGKDNAWLLVKADDKYASKKDITKEDRSVKTGKKISDMDPDFEDTWDKSGRKPAKKKGKSKKSGEIDEDDPETPPAVSIRSIPIKPMLATLADAPFDRKGWIFETKYDGYRTITTIEKGKADLISRNNISFNDKFREIQESLDGFTHDVVLDGEVVAEDKKGKAEFQLLQQYSSSGRGHLVYYIFDLLFLDGQDLRSLPLLERKKLLKILVEGIGAKNIRFSSHVAENGKKFFEKERKAGSEGMMAKNGTSIYKSGVRSEDWLKIKLHLRQEAIICGWTEPRGSRKDLGALILGVYENGELKYIGHTGGGFGEVGLANMRARLEKLEVPKSPFKEKVKPNAPVHWVKPKLVCEVSFQTWTDEGIMRQPIFEGMRDDKDAKDVKREVAESSKEILEEIPVKKSSRSKDDLVGLELTHLDKVFWPKEKITKGDLVEYYQKIAPYILPYLKDRAENLNRFPNGITEKNFYQKDTDHQGPDWLQKIAIHSDSEDKDINYLVCNDLRTLVYMANLGCIEINPWNSRIDNLRNPDFMVIDLDPEKISFEKVIEAAQVTREVLEKAGIESYCKTSGATGLHIFIPMGARYDYDQVKEFAHLIATLVNDRLPKTTSLERSPSKRQKKIYLDFLQNRIGQTLAAPYSARPKPGATVSAPLKWSEVKPGLTPQDFNIKNIFKRLEKVGDLWKPVLGKGVDIEKALKKLG